MINKVAADWAKAVISRAVGLVIPAAYPLPVGAIYYRKTGFHCVRLSVMDDGAIHSAEVTASDQALSAYSVRAIGKEMGTTLANKVIDKVLSK